VLQRTWRGALLLGVGAGSVALLLGWPGAPWALWGSVAVLAALGMLAFTNGILLALLCGKLGTGERAWQVLPWLAAGLLLALAETGAVALARAWWLGAA
jgi:hypothetical protein